LIPLDNLSILKLDEKAVEEYKEQLEVDVEVPYNEEGDMKVIHPWKVRSIYQYSDNYYYLHPEMVEQTNSSKCPQAAICNVCKSKIDSGTEASKITNSIASGVDFGNPDRLEVTFEKPSLREHLLMALVRPYATIIKLQNKNSYKHTCLQSAIKGSSIVFEHDSPQVVSNLLSTESMNSNMCIHFVGAKGEFDSMIKRTLEQRTADIYGRPYVIFQWLKLLSKVNEHYQGMGIEEMEFQTLKDLVVKSNKILVENHECIVDVDAQERNEQMTDDVAGIRSPPASNNEKVDNTNDSDNVLDLQYSYLATKKSTPNKSKEDSTNAYLRSAAKTIGVNISEEEAKYNASKSYRSEVPVNEFEKGEFGLVAGFPHVCLLGTAYNKKSCNLSESDCLHLLMQYTNIPATCKLLIFYLFDIKRRHQNICGMSAKVKGDSVAFNKFVSEFSSSNFQDRLRRGVKNPSGNDAKYVLSKLMPVLVTAGKHTTLGSLERNSSVGEMLAMIRRRGSSFCFLTCTVDDVHNPNVLRLSSKHYNNTDYPSLCPTDFLDALKTGKDYESTTIDIPTTWTAMKEQVNGNPVASAFMYKRLVYAVTKVLVGLKSSTTSGSGNRTVRSKRITEDTWTGEDNGVIISNTDAYCGVHECSGRGALHFHLCLFGGVSPFILQNGIDDPEIRSAITKCLDQMFCSQLPSNFHIKKLVEKELSHCPGGNPTIRKGRAELIPPDPLKKEEFENHVYTTVSDCGIHSHKWNSIGTCHKPPRGLTGCRLNKPDNPIYRTGPVQLKEMTRTEDELTYRVLNEIRDEGKDKGEFDIETLEEAKKSIDNSQSLHPLDDPDPRLITWQIANPNIDPHISLPELADCTDYQTLNNARKKKYIINALSDAMKMDNKDTDDADNGYDFQTTVPIKIKKRKKSPGSDTHTNKIAKICIPEDMNIDEREREVLNDALSHHSNKVAKTQTEDTKVSDESEYDKTNEIGTEIERPNRKRKRCRDDHNVVCVHCINRNLRRPQTLIDDECVHVAKSARIDISTWIPRRTDSMLRDSSYDEDDLADDDENTSSHEVDDSNDEEIQSITSLFKVMKLLGTLSQIRPNDAEVQKIISSLEGLDLEEIEMIYANVRKRLKGMNGYVVQYNKLLTALLGCNTNSMLLGSTEQSKAATFYIGPYIDKNKNPLIESLDIVLKAMDLARKYPSVADDSDTPRRITQLIMTKILNQLNNLMEVSDTQAAAGLLGISAGMCSDKFVVYDANCHNNFVSDECKIFSTTDNTDSGTDDDTYIYSSMDDSSLNDNSYSDGEDSDMIPSEVEIDDNTSHGDSDCDYLPSVPDRNESLPFYNSAYGSYPLYKGNDNQLIPVPYPLLYRCRGEELKELNRYEYFSSVEIIRNKKVTATQHNTQNTNAGRKESSHYLFSDDFPLYDSHHQIIRSKQCTLKLYANPPSPPGKPPSEDSPDYKQWKKKADIYAKYLLILFRSEQTLYNQSITNHLKYDWEAYVQFVDDLREGDNDKTNEQYLRNACILREMSDLITGTKTTFYKRMILSHYRARNRTIWSEQQQAEGFAQYRHMKQNIRTIDYDDIDNEIDDLIASNILSDYQERQIMQRVAYSDQLIRQLKTSSKPITDGNLGSNEDRSTHEVGDQLHIKTVPFDDRLSYRILEDPSNDQIEGDAALPSNDSTDSTNASAMDARVEAFIKSKNLSQDKLNAVQTMYRHFKDVLYSDEVKDPPNLLIVGAPGTGKSWLVDIISEIATIYVGLQDPIKSAFMGIAAINIGGSTINSLFDIPINLSRQYKNETKPWNSDLLEEFKRKYNLDKVSTIIIDEISMVKPWMLTYIDARMKEAMQSDKPFGGKALIMLGDFDQCPPVGGNTMPHLAMEMLERNIWSQRNYLSNVSSQKRKSKRSRFELESSLTRRGVQIFKSAGLMELSIQHRSAKDQDHTNLLKKMSSGSKIKTADLKNYKTLSVSDMTPDGFLFAPVIVTGNYERRAINSFQAKMYATYHNTHVVRWKRKIGSKWDNKPTNAHALEEAQDEPCFWEYFVPRAPAFLTTNINVNNDLANGTEVRMDSLSFQSPEDEEFLSEMIKSEPFGSIIDMRNPPSAINVELYADDVWDSSETKKKNASKRSEWKVGSVVNDDRVVVPISLQHNKSDFEYDNVRGKGGAIRFRASRVLLADNFPIELGFSYTVNKSQGRTIRKEIVSLSEHPDPKLTYTWEKLYTVISRIQQNPDMRLLLKGGGRSTINYIANLEKDKYTALYFKGFPPTETSQIRYWDEKLAAKAAHFI